MGIKSLLDTILCKSNYVISLESVIEQFNEHGVILTSEEISWIEKEMILFSIEAIDDDDIASVSSELKNSFDEICSVLANCEPKDDGLSSYDPPYRIAEETADYSSGNNLFLEVINQDFNEIASNCDVDNDIDEQIKTIIEEMKMDW